MRILLITQKFSPNNSVGARRWSKFYKYLKLNHLDIFVITQVYKEQRNYWGINTNNDKGIIRLDSLFNQSFNSKFISKLVNVIQLFLFHKVLKFTDNGYLFNLKAYRKAKKLIHQNNITHIISTSPSNSTAYFAAKLKVKFPHLILIQDFRDAWMQAYDTYKTGYPKTHRMYKKEMRMEAFAAKKADIIISVVPEIVAYFKNYNPYTSLITNGFDPDDFPSQPVLYPDHILKKNKINICHFGTLDFGRETECLIFLLELVKDKTFFDQIHFTFIGYNHPDLIARLKMYSNIVFIKESAKQEVKEVMFYAQIHLAINDKTLYYAYGSKLFDAFLYKKPVIFVTKAQYMTEFIESHKIGITIDTDQINVADIELRITDLLKRAREDDFTEQYSKRVTPFDLTQITKKLIDVIHSKNNP